MATNVKTSGISMLAVGAGLTTTLVVAYLVCWLTAAAPNANLFAHAWLKMFSAQPQGSVAQLVEGLIYSAVFAWFAALIFVPIYNLAARAHRVI